MRCLIIPSIKMCDQWYGRGGCAVLGRDDVGNGAFVPGVPFLSCGPGTGGAGAPRSLDGSSADQPRSCKLTHSRNILS